MDMAQLDKNFVIDTQVAEPDMKLYDIRQDPFQIYGLYNPQTEPVFRRMPEAVGKSISPVMDILGRHVSGARVRFCTDSAYVIIKTVYPNVVRSCCNTLLANAGVTLYLDTPDGSHSAFHKPFLPPTDMTDGYESKIVFAERKTRYITLYLPLQNEMTQMYVGLQADATLDKGAPYRDLPPLVFYGSSITQGACASRPGLTYQGFVSRALSMDYRNFGFGGNALAQPEILAYMASLPMSAFISEYDYNTSDADLPISHMRMYQTIRASHPHIPFVMMSRSSVDYRYEQSLRRRDSIIDTFRYARSQGDKNVYFIDGESIFRGPLRDSCTVDNLHPNDLGFSLMADAIICDLHRAGF